MESAPERRRKQSVRPKSANGRGSIYIIKSKSSQKVYRAAVFDITGKRRVKNFKKRSDAEDWLAEQRRARQYGENTYATNPKMTVGEFLIGWVETQYGEAQSSTQRYYRNAIKNHIIPTLGNIRADNLNSKAIEALLRDMAVRKYSAGTINSVKATLSAAYNNAVRLGDLTRNPTKHIKRPVVNSSPTKPLPHIDWEKVYIEAMKDSNQHARLEVAGMLGLRPGEALGLKWSDINFDSKTLLIERQLQRVRGKGLIFKAVKQKKVRTISISDVTIQILLTHRRYQALQKAGWASDEGLIFPNSIGKPMDEKADRKSFKKILNRAGVQDYQLYQLRKTAFTNFASTSDLFTLKEFSGHSQVSTLMEHYVFSSDETMRKAVVGMDRLRPGGNK